MHREREQEKERARERERGYVICETVKTQKWYYVHNMRSAYFPINRRLIEREREAMRNGENTETVLFP